MLSSTSEAPGTHRRRIKDAPDDDGSDVDYPSGFEQEGKHEDNGYREDKLIKEGVDGVDAFGEVFLYVNRGCPQKIAPLMASASPTSIDGVQAFGFPCNTR